MKVNTKEKNLGFASLIEDRGQKIAIDANFLIPPDRSGITKSQKKYEFDQYRLIWLDPLFELFTDLCIHEAVNKEILIDNSLLREYLDDKILGEYKMEVLKDAELSIEEECLRVAVEERIYPNTKYNPTLDNSDDRGEVKTLAHIAVKNYLYFGSNDGNALRLVEQAEKLDTGLEQIDSIHPYELIYLIHMLGKADASELKNLYRYQFRLSQREKSNPSWKDFLDRMEELYHISRLTHP